MPGASSGVRSHVRRHGGGEERGAESWGSGHSSGLGCQHAVATASCHNGVMTGACRGFGVWLAYGRLLKCNPDGQNCCLTVTGRPPVALILRLTPDMPCLLMSVTSGDTCRWFGDLTTRDLPQGDPGE